MNLIVAVDRNWGIGKENQLLFSISEDMKFFRRTTLDKVVLMGRKTLESFPESKPLPRRTNIVLTTDVQYKPEGVIVCHSKEEALELLKEYSTEEIFVIGGKTIYELFLDECDTAYITKIAAEKDADTRLVNMDLLPDWECVYTSEPMQQADIEYTFNTYRNRKYHPVK